jgi:putative peptide zinc metalloprotease protein
MPDAVTLLPCLRHELIVRQLGNNGSFVVKDPRSGAFYQFGDEEHFLLTHLDGQHEAEAVRQAFAARFGQMLSKSELREFLDMVRDREFLVQDNGEHSSAPLSTEAERRRNVDDAIDDFGVPGSVPLGLRILYWRKSAFDPDRLFTWLEPKIRFCWTPAFVICSASCIGLATAIVWSNRLELAGLFLGSLSWETAVFAWLVLMGVTTLHEFAHGLTCKHHGGEVHEIGFLLIFFMPYFYCNVSDAWLFREKSKRIWVTLAGGYFELSLWALAVFIWRLTMPETLINYLAFVLLSACGVQTLFNFNPLLKLDGYYLLSDWMEVPNLQQRSAEYIKALMRWLLWGAPSPAAVRSGRLLLLYGMISWLYSLFFLGITLYVFSTFLGARWGLLGFLGVVLLSLVSLRGLFFGFTAGEFRNMLVHRHKRTLIWILCLGGLAAILCFVPMDDRASGSFYLRPATHAELRARVAGFLNVVYCDEGDRVSSGTLVACQEIPDLESRLAQKQADMKEAQAKLSLLTVGARPEEVAEQRQRVARALAWRELGEQDLKRTQRAFEEDQNQLEKQIAAAQAELEVTRDNYQRAKVLTTKNALTSEQFHESDGRFRVAQARMAESQAAKRAHLAKGTLVAEAEVARREKELADARAQMRILEAGSRPEEIQVEQAHLARVSEEVSHLVRQRELQVLSSPVAGLVTTPRLKEKVRQYFKEGDLICVVEEPAALEAAIVLTEQDVARVRPGQKVELKARALPFETYTTQVDRIAPAADRGEVQSKVSVYCRMEQVPADLRPGMTGYARIYMGRRSIGEVLLNQGLRFFRTEFWW